MSLHLFDEALRLEAQADGSYLGHTHPAWHNMVGPFGGITAATMVSAITQHPECLGSPVSLTVNFAAGITPGPYTLNLRAARTNRSTQHWVLDITQTQPDGSSATVLTGTAMTALPRDTWALNDSPMPQVPGPEDLKPVPTPEALVWLARYELRNVSGPLPAKWDGRVASDDHHTASQSQLWVRDQPARPLDYAAVTAMSDIFFPRVWLRRAHMVPAGTVSLTVYFHASAQQLAQASDGYVLAQARAQAFSNGFFDQTAQLWSHAGALLATSHQLVYYKE